MLQEQSNDNNEEFQDQKNEDLNSQNDSNDNVSFFDYLKLNSQQTQIQELIDKYHNINGSEGFRIKRKLKSMKEEVLDIIQNMPNSEDILQNIPNTYQQENTEQIQGKIVSEEIRQLNLPIDIFEITERCEDLEQILKVVNAQLSFNVMKHSDEFVQGMTNIKQIQEDLTKIKDIASQSKATVHFMRQKIALNIEKSIVLKRKKERLIIVKKITQDIVIRYLNQEKQISKMILRLDIVKALEQ